MESSGSIERENTEEGLEEEEDEQRKVKDDRNVLTISDKSLYESSDVQNEKRNHRTNRGKTKELFSL